MSKTKNMSVGSPAQNLVSFAIPVFLGLLFQQVYNITDTVIVGQFLGEKSLAAVGSSGTTVYLLIGIAAGLTQGCGVLVAQSFGAGRIKEMRHIAAMSMIVVAIASVILTVPAVLGSRGLLVLMNSPADIIDETNLYLKIMFGGIVFTMAYNIASSILRAMGDSRTSLLFLIISSMINISMDLVFIVFLKAGTGGVAVATVISQAASAILIFTYMFKHVKEMQLSKEDFEIDPVVIRNILKLGFPMALNQSTTTIGIMILQSGVNRFGSGVVAAYAADSKLEALVQQPMIAMGMAASTFCAQNLGAGRTDRIGTGMKTATALTAAFATVGVVIYYTLGRFIVDVFINEASPEIYGYAQEYLNNSVWFLYPLGMIFLFRNAMVGVGEAYVPMLGGLVELTFRSVCTHFLPTFFGYTGLTAVNPVTWIFTSVYFISAFLKWYTVRSKKHSVRIRSC